MDYITASGKCQGGIIKCIYLGKVFTEFTPLVINNLSVYTRPYIFCEVFTSLVINNLSVYINVNVTPAVANGKVRQTRLRFGVRQSPGAFYL
jgi:hypothetical protein